MIGYINGTIAAMDENTLVLDHDGIGFNIFITSAYPASHHIGDEVRIYTYMSVKESSTSPLG